MLWGKVVIFVGVTGRNRATKTIFLWSIEIAYIVRTIFEINVALRSFKI